MSPANRRAFRQAAFRSLWQEWSPERRARYVVERDAWRSLPRADRRGGWFEQNWTAELDAYV